MCTGRSTVCVNEVQQVRAMCTGRSTVCINVVMCTSVVY